MSDPLAARLSVDLDALAANYRTLAKAARGAEVAPAIKADAYGLGVSPVAVRLWAEGVRAFFVARVAEGEELRASLGPARPATIYVLDGCPPGAAGRLTIGGLTPILNSLAQVEDWAAHARAGGPATAGLHVDTGMNRLGLRIEEVEALLAAPDRLHGVEIALVMSHLACADDPAHPLNRTQLERFRRAARLFPQARKSLANSGGVFLGEDYLFDMVRPGIALYGGGPLGRPNARIRPVASLLTPILQIRAVPPGESIGYGASYLAERSRRVAIVAAGYADGILRAESPGRHGWIADAPCPFLGRISMDLLALDVTDCLSAAPGDEVELFGPNVPLDDAARAAGTISYELLVRLGGRLVRQYLGGEEPCEAQTAA